MSAEHPWDRALSDGKLNLDLEPGNEGKGFWIVSRRREPSASEHFGTVSTLVINSQLEETSRLCWKREGETADSENSYRVKPVGSIMFQKKDGANKRCPGDEHREQSPGPLPQPLRLAAQRHLVSGRWL